jgi:hypothetical protein
MTTSGHESREITSQALNLCRLGMCIILARHCLFVNAAFCVLKRMGLLSEMTRWLKQYTEFLERMFGIRLWRIFDIRLTDTSKRTWPVFSI